MIKSQTRKQHYPELWTGLIIFYCITIVASLALYFVMWRENKRRERLPVNEEEANRLAFLDLTDKYERLRILFSWINADCLQRENPYFRYVL